MLTLSVQSRKPNDKQAKACMNAPETYKNFGPILVPNSAKIGANKKADRFTIPKTKPYWLEVAPFFSASLG